MSDDFANAFLNIDIFIGEKNRLKFSQRRIYWYICPNATENAY